MQQQIARIGFRACALLVLVTGLWLMAQLDGARQLGYRAAAPSAPQPVSALLTPLAPMPLSEEQQLILMVDPAGEHSRAAMARRYWEARQRDAVGTSIYLSELLRDGDPAARALQVEVVAHGQRVDPNNVRYDYLAAALEMLHHIRVVGKPDARVLRVMLPTGFQRALEGYVSATQRGQAVYRTFADEYVAAVQAVLPLPLEKQVQLQAWERFQTAAHLLPERPLLAMLEEVKELSGQYGDVGTSAALTRHLAAWEGRPAVGPAAGAEIWACVRLAMVAGALGVAAWAAFVLLLVVGVFRGWPRALRWVVVVIGSGVVLAAAALLAGQQWERTQAVAIQRAT